MGRTARGDGGAGKALLFLLPSELGFLRYLKDARVPLNEYDFPKNKVSNVQSQLEKLISKNYYLNRSAKDGVAQCYTRVVLPTFLRIHTHSCGSTVSLWPPAIAAAFALSPPLVEGWRRSRIGAVIFLC